VLPFLSELQSFPSFHFSTYRAKYVVWTLESDLTVPSVWTEANLRENEDDDLSADAALREEDNILRGTDVDLREENTVDVGTEVGLEGKENVYLESGTLLREEDDDGSEESLTEDKTVVEELKRVPLQLAIAGRPNVGKSTLLNALVRQERVLTGPEPGLTRDSIRVQFDYDGQTVYLVSELLFAFLCSLVSRDSFFN
jgi:hypothetical protein